MSCSRNWNVRKMVSASKWVSIFLFFLIRRFLNTHVIFFSISNNSCDVSFDGRLTCQEKVKNSLSKNFHWFVNDEVFADWCKYVLNKKKNNKQKTTRNDYIQQTRIPLLTFEFAYLLLSGNVNRMSTDSLLDIFLFAGITRC